MDIVLFKYLASFFVFTVTVAAAYYPFVKKIRSNSSLEFPVGESLAAGVFFGAGLLHMLSDSEDGFQELGYNYPFASLLAAITFLLLLLLEHTSVKLKSDNRNGFVYLAIVIFSIHAFLAGASLGVSDNLAIAVIVFFAIIAHKWAVSFALAVKINKSSIKIGKAFFLFAIFSMMVPLGILTGGEVLAHVHRLPVLEPMFQGLAAGTFIYLGTLHEFKHSVMIYRCCNYRLFAFMLAGFALMAIVAIWV